MHASVLTVLSLRFVQCNLYFFSLDLEKIPRILRRLDLEKTHINILSFEFFSLHPSCSPWSEIGDINCGQTANSHLQVHNPLRYTWVVCVLSKWKHCLQNSIYMLISWLSITFHMLVAFLFGYCQQISHLSLKIMISILWNRSQVIILHWLTSLKASRYMCIWKSG